MYEFLTRPGLSFIVLLTVPTNDGVWGIYCVRPPSCRAIHVAATDIAEHGPFPPHDPTALG